MYYFKASPGKTMLSPPSTIVSPAATSSDMNRSPNNTLRITGGITPPPNTSVAAATTTKSNDKTKV